MTCLGLALLAFRQATGNPNPASNPTEKRILELVDRHELGQAIPLLETELKTETDPERVLRYHGYLGDLYAFLMQPDKAIPHYDVMIQAHPNDGSLYFRKASTLGSQIQKRSEAMALVVQAREKGFENADLYAMQGYLFRAASEAASNPKEKQSNLKSSLESYQKAIELQPKNVSALGSYADLAFTTGQYTEAEKTYQRIIAVAPDSSMARIRLAHTQIRLGQHDAGIKLLRSIETQMDRSNGPSSPPTARLTWMKEKASVQAYLLEALMAQQKQEGLREVASKLLTLTTYPADISTRVQGLDEWHALAEDTLKSLETSSIPGASATPAPK